MTFFDQQKAHFKQADVATKLIYINVILFILLLIASVLGVNNVLNWVVLNDRDSLLFKPWTLFTYSFVHSPDDLFHLISNMLFLYYFGQFFLYYFSEKTFLNVYILGAISGGIFFLLLTHWFPIPNTSRSLLGASASIYAIMTMVIAYQPNQTIRLFGLVSVKLWHIAVFFVILNLIQLNHKINEGGIWSHLGGVLIGYFYLRQFNRGDKIGQVLERTMSLFRRTFAAYSSHPVKKQRVPKTDEEFNSKKKKNQEKINRILDKISKSGYESLTKEEKSFLFNQKGY